MYATCLVPLLKEQGLIDDNDLARAEQVRTGTGGRLTSTLARLGLVSEEDIARGFSQAMAIDLIDRSQMAADAVLIERLNPLFLRRHAILPLQGDATPPRVAMADPEDDEARRGLQFACGIAFVPVVATFSDISELLGQAVPASTELGALDADYLTGADADIDRMLEEASDAPVIRLVQDMLTRAATRGASDVHVEPMARHLLVRYRIDGQLVEAERYSDGFSAPVASRIKILAGLDIAESRLPQDGRLRLTVRGREIDVRVATSPTAWGESIVLRLLGRTTVPLDLLQLGLPAAALARLLRAIERPHGILLVTGPTGSGKTTTLYAAINRLKRPEVKILTVEDPVEVLLEGINQVQVRPEIGLGYPETLRAFLRQDPDILMIGEIRDRDTADIAMRAALTGHLVLSTLHTNSALGAFTRLADIGIEPYLAASTVSAAVAQRLIRRLCETCRVARPLDAGDIATYASAGIEAPPNLHEPGGCPACHGSGYRGRLPLIEVVEIDEDLRILIRTGRAEDHGLTIPARDTLFGHGLKLAADGVTSLAEVRRAVDVS